MPQAFALLVCLTGLLSIRPSPAQAISVPAEPAEKRETPAAAPVSQLSLENGLRVVLARSAASDTVAVCSVYDAGTRRQARDQPGVAQLTFAFVRSRRQRDALANEASLVSARGGAFKNELTADFARFCTVLPASELELALWLEAGRMSNLAVTQDMLSRYKREIAAEYDSPAFRAQYKAGLERLFALSFGGVNQYENAALAAPWQLTDRSLGEVRRFHRKHYRSTHMVLAIAGNFDEDQARKLVERYLGHPEFQGRRLADVNPEAPRQSSERLSVMEDAATGSPAVYYGFLIPPRNTREHLAFEVAARILAGSPSSIFSEALVRKTPLARDVLCWTEPWEGVGLFAIRVRARDKTQIDPIEDKLELSLRQFVARGPTPEELAAAKQQLLLAQLERLSSLEGRALFLAQTAFYGGDPTATDVENRYAGVTASQISQVLASHVTRYQRSVVELYPPGWHDPNQVAMPRYHIVERGQTLIGIAKRYGTSVEAITKMNGISSKKPIYPGQKFRVPAGRVARTYKVKKGDTLTAIARRFGTTVNKLARTNGLNKKRPIRIGQSLTIPR